MMVIFMGTPEFAVPTLTLLATHSTHRVIQVITAADKPRGRGRNIRPVPVKRCAESLDIPVMQPEKLDEHGFLQTIRAQQPDIFVVVGFRILPETLFSIPRHGTINLHASLLPKYRGAAPVQWALINGESITGVTTFKIESGVDTGEIIFQKKVTIKAGETAGELSERLSELGARLVIKTLDAIEKGVAPLKKQKSAICSPAPKITPSMRIIDWEKPAAAIVNLIRGLSPEPGAVTSYKKVRLKIFRARLVRGDFPDREPGTILKADSKEGLVVCAGQDAVSILSLQREGKQQMSTGEFLRGMRLCESESFQ